MFLETSSKDAPSLNSAVIKGLAVLKGMHVAYGFSCFGPIMMKMTVDKPWKFYILHNPAIFRDLICWVCYKWLQLLPHQIFIFNLNLVVFLCKQLLFGSFTEIQPIVWDILLTDSMLTPTKMYALQMSYCILKLQLSICKISWVIVTLVLRSGFWAAILNWDSLQRS